MEGVDRWRWFVVPPRTDWPPSELARGRVTEHENGSITIDGSLVVDFPPRGRWHGYLVKGEWATLADSVLG